MNQQQNQAPRRNYTMLRNHWTGKGFVAGDPWFGQGKSGETSCRLRIGVGTRREDTQWVNVWVHGNDAERLRGRVGKGSLVIVRGPMTLSTYNDRKSGQPVSNLQVNADDIEICMADQRQKRDDAGQGGPQPTQGAAQGPAQPQEEPQTMRDMNQANESDFPF